MELIEFTISHYCERARWGLDRLGLAWRPRTVLPGPHIATLRRLGLRRTTVPVLVEGELVLQGSGRILDWAQAQALAVDPEARRLVPEAPELAAEVQAWEKRLDREAGDGLRRILYAALLDHPGQVIGLWTQGGPAWGRALYVVAWPLMRVQLRRHYRLVPEAVAETRAAFEALADDLDAAWGEGGWLVGEGFTRADLTAASLLAPLCMPTQHPVRWPGIDTMPAEVRALHAAHAGRPWFRRVLALYGSERSAQIGSQ